MYCPKCGNTVGERAFFCQWCGEKIDLVELGAMIERIKYLRKPYNDRTRTDIELCKYISRIYREGKHLQNYDSLEEFGFHELGIDKSSIFMYKNVGEKLLDSNGDLLIMRGSEWGLGSLNELYTLDIETINTLIEQGIIYPSMKQKELRERIKKIKEFLMKM